MSVTALRATCDLVTHDDYRDQLEAMDFPASRLDRALADFDKNPSFTVTAVVVFDDAQEILWRDDRGFSVFAFGFGVGEMDVWTTLSRDRLADAVRRGVMDDTVEGGRQERAELALLLRAHGMEVLPEQLAGVPFEVVFSERLTRRLDEVGNVDVDEANGDGGPGGPR